jgi:uncharacterized membrane protein
VRLPGASLLTKALIGSLAFGWGLFNVVEGTINHHILHIHHVRETPSHLAWDIGFLVTGFMLIAVGLVLIRAASRDRLATSP